MSTKRVLEHLYRLREITQLRRGGNPNWNVTTPVTTDPVDKLDKQIAILEAELQQFLEDGKRGGELSGLARQEKKIRREHKTAELLRFYYRNLKVGWKHLPVKVSSRDVDPDDPHYIDLKSIRKVRRDYARFVKGHEDSVVAS